MKKIILKIKGMSCNGCASRLERYLKDQKGVLDASVSLEENEANISYDDDITILDLENYIYLAGFESLGEK